MGPPPDTRWRLEIHAHVGRWEWGSNAAGVQVRRVVCGIVWWWGGPPLHPSILSIQQSSPTTTVCAMPPRLPFSAAMRYDGCSGRRHAGYMSCHRTRAAAMPYAYFMRYSAVVEAISSLFHTRFSYGLVTIFFGILMQALSPQPCLAWHARYCRAEWPPREYRCTSLFMTLRCSSQPAARYAECHATCRRFTTGGRWNATDISNISHYVPI